MEIALYVVYGVLGAAIVGATVAAFLFAADRVWRSLLKRFGRL